MIICDKICKIIYRKDQPVVLDLNLLLSQNRKKYPYAGYTIDKTKTMFIYSIKNSFFGLTDFSDLLSYVNFCIDMQPFRLPFKFILDKVTFYDKLSYICLELLCYHLITIGYKVYLDLQPNYGIGTKGIHSAPMNLLNINNHDEEKFLKSFEFEIYRNHYRFIAKAESENKSELPTRVMNDTKLFLKFYDGIEEKHVRKIAGIVAELTDNSLEHTDSDCLIDIDVSEHFIKENDPNGEYFGINIAILDIGKKLLGNGIRRFINSENNPWYTKLKEAYKLHSSKFNLLYDENDFFILSAFQNNISSRKRNYVTGGTGLTSLISMLEEDSDAYKCYAITGNHIVNFTHDTLKLDDDLWVGFNKENDFLHHPPDKAVIRRSSLVFSGTAYNLIFVLKKGEF